VAGPMTSADDANIMADRCANNGRRRVWNRRYKHDRSGRSTIAPGNPKSAVPAEPAKTAVPAKKPT
jgi:hypothetical protein